MENNNKSGILKFLYNTVPGRVVLSCFVDAASVLVDVPAGISVPTGRVSTGANVLLQAVVIRVTDVMTAAVIRRLKLYLLISNTFFLSHYVYFLL